MFPPTQLRTISSFNTATTNINLTTSFVNVLTETITTRTTGYLMGQCAIQTLNPTNTDHVVSYYMVVNGSTSQTIVELIPKQTGSHPSTSNITFFHRTANQIPAATYSVSIFAKVDTITGGNTFIDHIDLICFGNLS